MNKGCRQFTVEWNTSLVPLIVSRMEFVSSKETTPSCVLGEEYDKTLMLRNNN